MLIDLIVDIVFDWGFKSRSVISWIIPLTISALCVAFALHAQAADRVVLAAILLLSALICVASKIYYVRRAPDPN